MENPIAEKRRPAHDLDDAGGLFARTLADPRLHRVLVVLGLFVLPLLYLTKQALIDPEIPFLPPSIRAGWALHSDQDIKNPRDAEFTRDFTLASLPERMELRCRAFKTMRLTLNGRELSPCRPGSSWKKPSTFDLAPHLRTGENHLCIRVGNDGAIPALLVEAPWFLRTRDAWRVALEPEFNKLRPAVSPVDRAPRPGPLQTW